MSTVSSTVYVNGRTDRLVTKALDILEAVHHGTKSDYAHLHREVPQWLPNGEECKSLAQVSSLMGLPEEIAAYHVLEAKDVQPELAADVKRFLAGRNPDGKN